MKKLESKVIDSTIIKELASLEINRLVEDKPEGLKYVGKDFPIMDAWKKVRGEALYTSDIKKEHMLFGKVLFSSIPHGRVLSIDTSEALKLDGVVAIESCFTSPKRKFNSGLRFIGHDMIADEQIFHEHVRYVGDRIGAVVAVSEKIAEKAIKLIKVEYKEYESVLELADALNEDAPAIHDGGNLMGEVVSLAGNSDYAIKRAAHSFEGEYRVQAMHHYAMEPHASLAVYDGDKLTLWSSTQNIFALRVILSNILELPINRVRVIKPTVGGGFGGKVEAVVEPIAAYMAMKVKRPVRFEYSRKECFVSSRTRHEAIVRIRTGFDNKYRLTGLDIDVRANGGAYASATLNVLGAMSAKSMMLYKTANISYRGKGVYTNSPVGGAFRGYGSPQLMTPLEMHMQEVAKELDMDPLIFKMNNLPDPFDDHPKGGKLGNARIKDCLQKGAEMIGWEDCGKMESSGPIKRALGFAAAVHGNGVYPKHIDYTVIKLTLHEDGSFTLNTGNQEIGEGNTTMLMQIAGEVLDVEPMSFNLVESDTELTSFDLGTFSSRCTWVSGRSAKLAAEMMRELILEKAAQKLERNANELKLLAGEVVSLDGDKLDLSYQDIGLYVQQELFEGELTVTKNYYSEANAGSYGAHFADVSVNTETGEVKINRYVAVHDVGRAINPLSLEGQIEGGVQMGMGYALSEKIEIDKKTGVVTNALTKKYGIFRAPDMPPIEMALIEKGEEPGPFGAKSIGEICTIPSAPAIINAVNNALGTTIRELPASKERILAEIKARDTN
jgi:CO/xanthine dehydrogenase Mo-binding subunit